MTAPTLPPIDFHDHPDPQSFMWTETEIRWIREYAAKHGLACYRAGQAEMRDRAVQEAEYFEYCPGGTDAIRELPINGGDE